MKEQTDYTEYQIRLALWNIYGTCEHALYEADRLEDMYYACKLKLRTERIFNFSLATAVGVLFPVVLGAPIYSLFFLFIFTLYFLSNFEYRSEEEEEKYSKFIKAIREEKRNDVREAVLDLSGKNSITDLLTV